MDFERLASQLGTVIVRRERESARAQLARLTHLDMDAPEVQAFYRDMEAAREEEEQVRGFRWHGTYDFPAFCFPSTTRYASAPCNTFGLPDG